MDETNNTQRLEAARTAAAVLTLLEGANAPIFEALRGLASEQQLGDIKARLTHGSRIRRSKALAAHLGRLVVDIDSWSLR